MSITVTKTNNDVLVVIEDGINDDSTTSLNLLGRNYIGYSERIADNQVRQLENFANDTAPTNPLDGQLWYNTTNNTLSVFDQDIGWSVLTISATSGTAPTNPKVGDLWFDTGLLQLNAWTGSAWLVIGPTTPSGFGFTGITVESIQDTLSNPHIVGKVQVDGNLIVIISQDAEFTAANAVIASTFGNIKSGYNITGSIPAKYWNGIASNSEKLNNLTSTQFLRANIPALTTSTLTVQNDGGVTIGQGNDLLLTVTDIHGSIKNNNSGGNLRLITGNTTALTINGSSYSLVASGTYGNAIVANANAFSSFSLATIGYVDSAVGGGNAVLLRDGTTTITGVLRPDTTDNRNFGSSSFRFNTIFAGNINIPNVITAGSGTFSSNTAATSSGTGAIVVTGGVGVGGNLHIGDKIAVTGTGTFSANITTRSILPNSNDTYDLGTAANKYRTIYANTFSGTSTQAQYADLAEIYTTDIRYNPGTVVVFGGDREITISQSLADTTVAGVISQNPGLLLNSDELGLPVALHGKVRCKVTGAGIKGQMLVTSDLTGVACVTKQYIGGAIIGKSLEDFDFGTAVGTVYIVVGVN